jgi:nucleoside-diphosphate-sugar epimerase
MVSSSTPPPLVLITGANGHIGFRVLVFVLRAGYRVRACVRNADKQELILAAQSIKELDPGTALEFAVIPDLLRDDAYDDAVQGVTIAVHIGGPIAHGDEDLATLDETLVQPSVRGTMNMLRACEKSRSVRRVVLTSSVIALVPWRSWLLEESSETYDERSRVPDDHAVHPPFSMAWEAYSNAKILSLNATERWVRDRRRELGFDVVNMHPSVVIGPHELARSKAELVAGVNFAVIMCVMGQVSPYAIPGVTVHVDDVAEAFVRVLDGSKVGTGEDGLLSVIAHSGGPAGTVWDDVLEIVREKWPRLVERGVLPCTGSQPSKKVRFDAESSERVLGIKFRGYEKQVESLFEQWIPLLEKEGGDVKGRVV